MTVKFKGMLETCDIKIDIVYFSETSHFRFYVDDAIKIKTLKGYIIFILNNNNGKMLRIP